MPRKEQNRVVAQRSLITIEIRSVYGQAKFEAVFPKMLDAKLYVRERLERKIVIQSQVLIIAGLASNNALRQFFTPPCTRVRKAAGAQVPVV